MLRGLLAGLTLCLLAVRPLAAGEELAAVENQLRLVFGGPVEELSSADLERVAGNVVRVARTIAGGPLASHMAETWLHRPVGTEHSAVCPTCYQNLSSLTAGSPLATRMGEPEFPLLFAIGETYYSLSDGAIARPVEGGPRDVGWWIVHEAGEYVAIPTDAGARRRAVPAVKVAGGPSVEPIDLRFSDAGGRLLTLRDFDGRLRLLHLWATWCAPCHEELRALDRLQTLFDPADLRVVAVAVDTAGRQVVERTLSRLGISHLPLHLDADGSALGALGVRGLPATFLIGPDEKVIEAHSGVLDWQEHETHLRSLLKSLAIEAR